MLCVLDGRPAATAKARLRLVALGWLSALLLSMPFSWSGQVDPAWFAQLRQKQTRAVDVREVGTTATTWKGQQVGVVPGQWIVQLTKAATKRCATVADTANLFGSKPFSCEVVGGLGMRGQLLIECKASDTDEKSVETFAAYLASHHDVLSFSPNYVVYADLLPDDPDFSMLWGLHNTGQTGGTPDADIDAPEAWEVATGSADIVVAVIDTGVDYTHPDLADNIWTNPGEIAGNGLDDDGNGFVDDVHGYDFCNEDGDPMDDNRHGTHVAGTIAGVGDNGQGVTGVNWSSSIMALKFLSARGSGSASDAVRAVNYATMMKSVYDVEVRLTSNSWGGGPYSQELRDAIEASGDAGVLFIAAAGNVSVYSPADNDQTPHYPSSYDLGNIIAVAASDHNDGLANFSHYGATSVDLAAPGTNIYSTVPDGGYTSLNGTSMATPHVAGVVALAWSTALCCTANYESDWL